MANLSDAQIAAAARAAGFTGESVAIAVAVALAESSGNPRAHNPVPPDNSYGLWQINMLGSMGPERRRQFGLSSNDQLFDPVTNARAAYAISSQGRNWKPWSTYTNQAYRLYMNRGRAAAGAPASSVPGGTVPAATGSGGQVIQTSWGDPGTAGGTVQVELDWRDFIDPFGLMGNEDPALGGAAAAGSSIARLLMQWTTALIKSARWLSNSDNWIRIVQVGAGAGLVLVGINAVARPLVGKAVAPALSAVVGSTPPGRAAKAGAAAAAAKSASKASKAAPKGAAA